MLKDFIFLAQVLVEFKNRCYVAAPVTVIGSTPNCDNCLIKHELESIHGELMCSSNEVDGIVICKGFCDVGTK